MQEIIKFLQENDLEYEPVTFGDLINGPVVDGLQVFFHLGFPECVAAMRAFDELLETLPQYFAYVGGGSYYRQYNVMTAADKLRLDAHKEAVKREHEEFLREIGYKRWLS